MSVIRELSHQTNPLHPIVTMPSVKVCPLYRHKTETAFGAECNAWPPRLLYRKWRFLIPSVIFINLSEMNSKYIDITTSKRSAILALL